MPSPKLATSTSPPNLPETRRRDRDAPRLIQFARGRVGAVVEVERESPVFVVLHEMAETGAFDLLLSLVTRRIELGIGDKKMPADIHDVKDMKAADTGGGLEVERWCHVGPEVRRGVARLLFVLNDFDRVIALVGGEDEIARHAGSVVLVRRAGRRILGHGDAGEDAVCRVRIMRRGLRVIDDNGRGVHGGGRVGKPGVDAAVPQVTKTNLDVPVTVPSEAPVVAFRAEPVTGNSDACPAEITGGIVGQSGDEGRGMVDEARGIERNGRKRILMQGHAINVTDVLVGIAAHRVGNPDMPAGSRGTQRNPPGVDQVGVDDLRVEIHGIGHQVGLGEIVVVPAFARKAPTPAEKPAGGQARELDGSYVAPGQARRRRRSRVTAAPTAKRPRKTRAWLGNSCDDHVIQRDILIG